MATTPVSPKVTASTLGGAFTTVVAYLLGHVIPGVSSWPSEVQFAVLVLVMAAGTAAAGYLKTDPLRNLGARFKHTGHRA